MARGTGKAGTVAYRGIFPIVAVHRLTTREGVPLQLGFIQRVPHRHRVTLLAGGTRVTVRIALSAVRTGYTGHCGGVAGEAGVSDRTRRTPVAGLQTQLPLFTGVTPWVTRLPLLAVAVFRVECEFTPFFFVNIATERVL